MPFKGGDPVPTAMIKQLSAHGIMKIATATLLNAKKVVPFGQPGAVHRLVQSIIRRDLSPNPTNSGRRASMKL